MLTLEKLRAITTGALEVWEEDGYFHFCRYTHRHFEAIGQFHLWRYDYQTKLDLDERCRAASGIRLEFTTCGGTLSFDYRVDFGASHTRHNLEITVDGTGMYHICKEELPASGSVLFEIPKKDVPQRVTVYCSDLTVFCIKNLSLPADYAPVQRPLKYLALGDSITQGSIADHPNQTYTNLLADMLDAEVVNHAIGGVQFNPAYVDKNLPFRPDIITCSYGVNDWNGCHFMGYTQYQEFLDKITATHPPAKIFLLIPVWASIEETETRDGYTLEQVRQRIEALAAQYPAITVIDARRFIPHLADCFAEDNLHPNDLGFLHMAYHIYNAMKPYL